MYVLYRTAEGVARLDRRELDDGESWRLPFIKVAPNAAYLTPVFKVERKKGISESERRTTNKLFSSLRELGGDTADYFTAVVEVLESTLFCYLRRNLVRHVGCRAGLSNHDGHYDAGLLRQVAEAGG